MDIIGIIFHAVLYGIIYDSLKLAISLYSKREKPAKKDNAGPLDFFTSFLSNTKEDKKKKRKRKRKRKEDVVEEEEDITVPNLTKKSSDSNDFFKDVRKESDTPSSVDGLKGLLNGLLSGNGGTDGGSGGMDAILKMGAKLAQDGGIQKMMGELSKGVKGKENPIASIFKDLGDPKRMEKIKEKPDLVSEEDTPSDKEDIKGIIESLD